MADVENKEAFELIYQTSNKLGGLDTVIIERAKEIYVEVHDKKLNRRGDKLQSLVGASVMIAAQESSIPRTLTEISQCFVPRVPKSIIHDVVAHLKKKLNIGRKFLDTKELAIRYCKDYALDSRAQDVVVAMVDKIDNQITIHHSVTSAIPVLINMVSKVEGREVTIEELAKYSGIAIPTLCKTRKDLYEHVKVLFPESYVREEVLKNLYDKTTKKKHKVNDREGETVPTMEKPKVDNNGEHAETKKKQKLNDGETCTRNHHKDSK